MIDIKTVVKLSNAGFSAEEIEEFLAPKDTNGSDPAMDPASKAADPAPKAADPAPKAADPAPKATDPAPKAADPATKAADPAEGIDDLKNAINDGFKSIIEAFQVSAVGGSQQTIPAAKTSEDILAEIISPYTKPEGGKK